MEQIPRQTFLQALTALNSKLQEQGIAGEICIYGGGAMVLAFNARLSTKDLDAVFQPAETIRNFARQIGEDLGLPPFWLNDGVKGWLSPAGELTSRSLPQYSHLRLSRPTKRYLLAMKCMAARAAGYETQGDRSDLIFLVRTLDLHTAESVLQLVEQFYPESQILPKTRFFVEEVMHEVNAAKNLP